MASPSPSLVALFAFVFVLVSLVKSDVVVLTPDNFDQFIDGSKHALVEFYAPWCGHCKALEPTYTELGQVFAHAKKDVVIAKVDADAHRDLGSKFDVQGFPTIKWFPKGSTKPEKYEGGRDLDDFAKFIESKTSVRAKIKRVPSNVAVVTEGNFEQIVMDPKNNVLVEFYAPWCGHCKQLAPIYEKVGNVFATEKNCIVAKVDATVQSALADKYEIQGYPTIKFFGAGKDKKPEDYNGGRTEEDFVEFLNKKCGAKRVAGGGLSSEAGIIPAFADLVKKFLSEPSTRADTIKAAQKLAKQDAHKSNKYAKYYSKVMEKILKKADYPEKEFARLEKISSGSDSLTLEKQDDFTIRMNILKAFMKDSDSEKEVVKEEL
ncbi:thioredoxin-like protein [Paraphysoderma sedebokerense]|nr:thioredoxin-like protein [Paraphysoderma sedebokerense]